MPLTSPQRERAWYWFTTHRTANPPPAKYTKAELRAALDAATAWIEANQASYVAALAGTSFAGSASTPDEKRRLFVAAFASVHDVTELF